EVFQNLQNHHWYEKGQWLNVTGRYLGFRFRIKGKAHYGWARLNVRLSHYTLDATLTGYAYETVTTKPIIAGKTKGGEGEFPEHTYVEDPDDLGSGASLTAPIPDTPEAATLGALAMGAPGLSIWRRKESVSTTL